MTNDTRKAHEIAWYFETLEPGDTFHPDDFTMTTVLAVDVDRDRVKHRVTTFDRDWNVLSSVTMTDSRNLFARLYADAGYVSAEESRIMEADAREEFAR